MKQTIREKTFETNSSSYHSISIRRKSDKEKEILQEIEVGKETVLTGKIKYKTIGYTESYSFTSRTKLDKANMLCRYISAEIENAIYDLPEYDTYVDTAKDDKERRERKRELGIKHPLFSALVKAIEKYTGAPVKFDFNGNRWDDWFEPVYSETESLQDLVKTKDFDNEEFLTQAYYDIIFDDDIEITEECESNE